MAEAVKAIDNAVAFHDEVFARELKIAQSKAFGAEVSWGAVEKIAKRAAMVAVYDLAWEKGYNEGVDDVYNNLADAEEGAE